MEAFSDRLASAVRRCGNPVMVGLDPRVEQLPKSILHPKGGFSLEQQAAACYIFCRGVIDVVAPLVPVVKPQAAFFEQMGPVGMVALGEIIRYATEKGLLVVLDGKRNDIGSTAAAYAAGILGPKSPWGADALTVSPYLGSDSLEPFVSVARERGAGVFVLVKTSNPGGGMFQDLVCQNLPVYRYVADEVERLAAGTRGECGYGAVGAVVGATYPEQLSELRVAMPHAWLLVPGFGAQGAGAQDVASAFDTKGLGAVVNNSRGILFAHSRPPYAAQFGVARWQEAVEAATRDMIAQLRDATPVGRLPSPT